MGAKISGSLSSLVTVLKQNGGARLVCSPPSFIIGPLPEDTAAQSWGLGKQASAHTAQLSCSRYNLRRPLIRALELHIIHSVYSYYIYILYSVHSVSITNMNICTETPCRRHITEIWSLLPQKNIPSSDTVNTEEWHRINSRWQATQTIIKFIFKGGATLRWFPNNESRPMPSHSLHWDVSLTWFPNSYLVIITQQDSLDELSH